MKTIIPPYLQAGDTVGITCPAGYMDHEKAATCIHTLQDWGYQVMVGKTLGSSSKNYFSGTDQDRLEELQAMLDDDGINAILFARGGYGCSRIIDQLNFKKFIKKPKWLIGFSDITVFHNHLLSNFSIASLHAPMAAAFNEDGFKNKYVQSLKKMLRGEQLSYSAKGHKLNKEGVVQAPIVGGNLSILIHLLGTKSEADFAGKILFLEDVGEYIYNIDRMVLQLKRSGKLKHIKGLVLGGFTDLKDTTRPFGKPIEDVLRCYTDDLKIPVAFNFPISHNKENFAIKIGAQHLLEVGKKKVVLAEV